VKFSKGVSEGTVKEFVPTDELPIYSLFKIVNPYIAVENGEVVLILVN